MGTSATVRLIEGVRLIRCPLNTGFTVTNFMLLDEMLLRPLRPANQSSSLSTYRSRLWTVWMCWITINSSASIFTCRSVWVDFGKNKNYILLRGWHFRNEFPVPKLKILSWATFGKALISRKNELIDSW